MHSMQSSTRKGSASGDDGLGSMRPCRCQGVSIPSVERQHHHKSMNPLMTVHEAQYTRVLT